MNLVLERQKDNVCADLHEQGFLQILAPLLLRYLSGRMHQRKQMMMTGMVLVVGGSIGAAFSRTVRRSQ